jgi:hypothetical protein
MSEHHEHHGTVLAQPDDTRSNVVAVLIGLLAIVFAITAYAIWTAFVREAEAINHELVLSKPNPELEALRAKEAEELRSAAVVDADKGIHRIPVEHAASLFVREAQARKQAGVPQRIEEPAAAVVEETTTP